MIQTANETIEHVSTEELQDMATEAYSALRDPAIIERATQRAHELESSEPGENPENDALVQIGRRMCEIMGASDMGELAGLLHEQVSSMSEEETDSYARLFSQGISLARTIRQAGQQPQQPQLFTQGLNLVPMNPPTDGDDGNDEDIF